MAQDRVEYVQVDAAPREAPTEYPDDRGTASKWKVGVAAVVGLVCVVALGCLGHATGPWTAASESKERALEIPIESPPMVPASFGKHRSCRGADGKEGTDGTSFQTHQGVSSFDNCTSKCQRPCSGVEYNVDSLECRAWIVPIAGTVEAQSLWCFIRLELVADD